MNSDKWICDSCGSEISEPEHGWVEWLTRTEGGRRFSRGLRLVHHRLHSPHGGVHQCQYDEALECEKDGSIVSDLPLTSFLGPDGLMRLLSMLDKHETSQAEIIEMIKRLNIPGYEHARFHFEEAINDGAFEPTTSPGFYPLCHILATLEWSRRRR